MKLSSLRDVAVLAMMLCSLVFLAALPAAANVSVSTK